MRSIWPFSKCFGDTKERGGLVPKAPGPLQGKKERGKTDAIRSQETEREVVPGHSGGAGCWQGPHVPDMAYRLECWYS